MRTNNSDLFNKEVNLATKHNQEVTKILMNNLNSQIVKSTNHQNNSFKDCLNQFKIKMN